MATNTYVALSTYTIPSSVASYTFTSIPQGYTDLVLVVTGVGATGTTFPWLRFNGLETNIYSDSALYGNGTSPGSNRRTANSRGYLAENVQLPITQIGNILVNIMNYSNSTTNKTWLVRNNNQETGTYIGVEAIVGTAQTTEPITSITIGTASGGTDYNFAAGSTFSLYGILAEVGGSTPKATGGVVTSDATYYYHSFLTSGNFVPNQTLSCDVLVVAGGGAGGGGGGAGGGAGGFRTSTGLSFSAANYSALVGAGGAGVYSATGNNGSDSVLSSITSTGGGGASGVFATAPNVGNNGGSGGGGNYNRTVGLGNTPSTSPSQGNNGGGSTTVNNLGTGGGGGAGAVGGTGTTTLCGVGGAGTASSLSGSSVTYAGGGGGGGSFGATPAAGGAGGGGAGAVSGVATSGTANTGGGGGGADTGGNGGSGIIVIRYLKA